MDAIVPKRGLTRAFAEKQVRLVRVPAPPVWSPLPDNDTTRRWPVWSSN